MTPSQKRVAIVAYLTAYGGIQACVFSLIRGLNDIGITPDILFDTPPNSELLADNHCSYRYRPLKTRISSRLIYTLPNTVRVLAKMFNSVRYKEIQHEYDFFYVFGSDFAPPPGPHLQYLPIPPLSDQPKSSWRAGRHRPINIIYAMYNRFFYKLNPVFELFDGARYVTVSEYTAQLFVERCGAKVPVIYPPTSLDIPLFELEDIKDRKGVLFISRIVDYKRPELVIELAKHFPDESYTIMGGVTANQLSYFEHLRSLVATHRLKNVSLQANPTMSELQAARRRAKFYLFTAKDEHFGMVTPEAIAAGVTPFVHDSGGQREIVPDVRLRFTDEYFTEKFEQLLRLTDAELNQIRQTLISHVLLNYSERIYQEKMLSYLFDTGNA